MKRRICDCESADCHPNADCWGTGTVKTIHSTICAHCAENMPVQYLEASIGELILWRVFGYLTAEMLLTSPFDDGIFFARAVVKNCINDLREPVEISGGPSVQ